MIIGYQGWSLNQVRLWTLNSGPSGPEVLTTPPGPWMDLEPGLATKLVFLDN